MQAPSLAQINYWDALEGLSASGVSSALSDGANPNHLPDSLIRFKSRFIDSQGVNFLNLIQADHLDLAKVLLESKIKFSNDAPQLLDYLLYDELFHHADLLLKVWPKGLKVSLPNTPNTSQNFLSWWFEKGLDLDFSIPAPTNSILPVINWINWYAQQNSIDPIEFSNRINPLISRISPSVFKEIKEDIWIATVRKDDLKALKNLLSANLISNPKNSLQKVFSANAIDCMNYLISDEIMFKEFKEAWPYVLPQLSASIDVAGKCPLACIELLKEKGLDWEQPDSMGLTFLHHLAKEFSWALYFEVEPVLQGLLQWSPHCLEVETKTGKKPEDFCKEPQKQFWTSLRVKSALQKNLPTAPLNPISKIRI